MTFFTMRWESCAGIGQGEMGIWVAGKAGFSERGVTCSPRETNVFVAGGRKTGARGEERAEIRDGGVLAQRGRFRFVPNKGIGPQGEIISEQWGHRPTTPSARHLGPIRKTRPAAQLATAGHGPASAAWRVGGRRRGRRRAPSSTLVADADTLRSISFPIDSSLYPRPRGLRARAAEMKRRISDTLSRRRITVPIVPTVSAERFCPEIPPHPRNEHL